MAQTSKIMPIQAQSILSSIFKAGNKIALFTSDPNTGTYTKPSAASYSDYTILSGDFETNDNSIYTARHLLFGLAEEAWATSANPVKAFGVYSGTSLIYWGMLTTAVAVAADTVPVFKVYNASTGEGIKVTLDVASTSSVSS